MRTIRELYVVSRSNDVIKSERGHKPCISSSDDFRLLFVCLNLRGLTIRTFYVCSQRDDQPFCNLTKEKKKPAKHSKGYVENNAEIFSF